DLHAMRGHAAAARSQSRARTLLLYYASARGGLMSGEVEHAPESDAPPLVGRLLAGRYRLQNLLGEGGMAIVYEGEHIAIGKRVAIKLVQSLFARDDEIVSRFEA